MCLYTDTTTDAYELDAEELDYSTWIFSSDEWEGGTGHSCFIEENHFLSFCAQLGQMGAFKAGKNGNIYCLSSSDFSVQAKLGEGLIEAK